MSFVVFQCLGTLPAVFESAGFCFWQKATAWGCFSAVAIGIVHWTIPSPVEVDFLPEGGLTGVQGSTKDSYFGGTGTFPIAHQLNQSDVENQGVHGIGWLVEPEERTGWDEGGGLEKDIVSQTESKNDVQSVGLHIVLITFVDKLGECLAERIVFCLVRQCFR